MLGAQGLEELSRFVCLLFVISSGARNLLFPRRRQTSGFPSRSLLGMIIRAGGSFTGLEGEDDLCSLVCRVLRWACGGGLRRSQSGFDFGQALQHAFAGRTVGEDFLQA